MNHYVREGLGLICGVAFAVTETASSFLPGVWAYEGLVRGVAGAVGSWLALKALEWLVAQIKKRDEA
jgi:uncharacterized membrane protein